MDVDVHAIQVFKKDPVVKDYLSTGETKGAFYVESLPWGASRRSSDALIIQRWWLQFNIMARRGTFGNDAEYITGSITPANSNTSILL